MYCTYYTCIYQLDIPTIGISTWGDTAMDHTYINSTTNVHSWEWYISTSWTRGQKTFLCRVCIITYTTTYWYIVLHMRRKCHDAILHIISCNNNKTAWSWSVIPVLKGFYRYKNYTYCTMSKTIYNDVINMHAFIWKSKKKYLMFGVWCVYLQRCWVHSAVARKYLV